MGLGPVGVQNGWVLEEEVNADEMDAEVDNLVLAVMEEHEDNLILHPGNVFVGMENW